MAARTTRLQRVPRAAFSGTEVHVAREGAPGVVLAQALRPGWQESLALPAKPVEAELKG